MSRLGVLFTSVMGVILTSCCLTNPYGVDPYFEWTYEDNLPIPDRLDVKVIDVINERARLVVQESLGLESIPPVRTEVTPRTEEKALRNGVFEFRENVMWGEIHALGDEVLTFHAYQYAFVLSHEFTEFCLAGRDVRGGNLYGNTRYNRWIGDGTADYTSSLLLDQCRDLFPPLRYKKRTVDKALRQGIESVSLNDWGLVCRFEEENDGEDEFVRYQAAEYVIAQWVEGCRKQGIEDPISRLFQWIRDHPAPSYKRVTDWMTDLSGLDVATLAQDVPLGQVHAYFEARNL